MEKKFGSKTRKSKKTKSIKWKRSRFDRSMRNDVKQKNGPGEYSSEFLVGRASEFSKCWPGPEEVSDVIVS